MDSRHGSTADSYSCQCVDGWADGVCLYEYVPQYTVECSVIESTATESLAGNCDIDVDECASAPCQNGALCADSTTNTSVAVGAYRCSCVDGFASGSCEYWPIVEAYAAACAILLSTDAASGAGNCAVDVDECVSGPCQNGGACRDSLSEGISAGTYTCLCQRGFANGVCDYAYIGEYADECAIMDGGNCDLDVDECASQPCQNGA